MMSDIDFWDWLDFGIEKGWIGKPTCANHDGLEMTEEDYQDDNLDLCIPVVRLWGQTRVINNE